MANLKSTSKVEAVRRSNVWRRSLSPKAREEMTACATCYWFRAQPVRGKSTQQSIVSGEAARRHTRTGMDTGFAGAHNCCRRADRATFLLSWSMIFIGGVRHRWTTQLQMRTSMCSRYLCAECFERLAANH